MSSSHCSGSARRGRLGVIVATVVLCAAVLPPTGAEAVPPAPGRPAPVTAGGTHTVTLLTGDRVRNRDLPEGRAEVVIEPGSPDRTGITFASDLPTACWWSPIATLPGRPCRLVTR
jgi:hypothetical protein